MGLKEKLLQTGVGIREEQVLDTPEALLCYGYDATRQMGQPQLAFMAETTA